MEAGPDMAFISVDRHKRYVNGCILFGPASLRLDPRPNGCGTVASRILPSSPTMSPESHAHLGARLESSKDMGQLS